MVLFHLPPPPKGRKLLSSNVFLFQFWELSTYTKSEPLNLRRNNLRALILPRASGLHPANVYRFYPLFAASAVARVALVLRRHNVKE